MRLIRYTTLLIFILLAGFSLIYIVGKTLDPSGATDFHSYWYSGHFIRQGTDPYTAFVNKETPNIPVRYLDGEVATSLPIAHPNLARVPANTAPMVEFLTIFSFFSWPLAKFLWMLCNLTLIIIILFLIFKSFPALQKRSSANQILLCLIFIGLFGTRNIAGNGQTSLLVFATMLLALMAKERWLLAGLALGFSLSKYSLALPILIIFLIEGRYRQIMIAAGVQIAALFLLSLFTRQSMISIVDSYLHIFQFHTDLPGIHIETLFPTNKLLGWISAVSLTIGTTLALGFWFIKNKGKSMLSQAQQTIFTILMLWTLLVAYHRAYDTFVAILFIALVIEWITNGIKRFSKKQLCLLRLLIGLTVIILTIPARGINILRQTTEFLEIWLRLQSNSITLLLIAILVCSIWLLYQFKPDSEITTKVIENEKTYSNP